jgi:putative sterol carrier protein
MRCGGACHPQPCMHATQVWSKVDCTGWGVLVSTGHANHNVAIAVGKVEPDGFKVTGEAIIHVDDALAMAKALEGAASIALGVSP